MRSADEKRSACGWHPARHLADEIARTLVATEPTTVAGAAALMTYAVEIGCVTKTRCARIGKDAGRGGQTRSSLGLLRVAGRLNRIPRHDRRYSVLQRPERAAQGMIQ